MIGVAQQVSIWSIKPRCPVTPPPSIRRLSAANPSLSSCTAAAYPPGRRPKASRPATATTSVAETDAGTAPYSGSTMFLPHNRARGPMCPAGHTGCGVDTTGRRRPPRRDNRKLIVTHCPEAFYEHSLLTSRHRRSVCRPWVVADRRGWDAGRRPGCALRRAGIGRGDGRSVPG